VEGWGGGGGRGGGGGGEGELRCQCTVRHFQKAVINCYDLEVFCLIVYIIITVSNVTISAYYGWF